MEQANNPLTSSEATYRLFVARIIAGWLFLIFLFLWGTKALPHHFPEILPTTVIDPELVFAYSLVWVIVSTGLLFFLIVPGRLTALVLFILMIIFIQSYRYGGLSLLNPAFALVLIPFILPLSRFKKSWLVFKWVLLLSLALHSWFLPLSLKAIPGYSLYLIPFILWERWFQRFNEQFEPK